MNNIQAFVLALCIFGIGAGLVYVGVRVIVSYSQYFRRDPQSTTAWDVLSTILAGPWSAPVVLAGLIVSLGAIALFVGGSIAIYILWFELSRSLS